MCLGPGTQTVRWPPDYWARYLRAEEWGGAFLTVWVCQNHTRPGLWPSPIIREIERQLTEFMWDAARYCPLCKEAATSKVDYQQTVHHH